MKNCINFKSLLTFPNAEDPEAVSRTARKHYDWLNWLNQADTTCTLVQEALTPIEKVYPIWKPRAHPDLMYWTSSSSWSLQSPWTVEQLLAKPPTEWLDELLSFQGNHFDGPNRDSLVLVIQEACKQQPSWALQLDAALSAPTLWNSDLWSPMLRGLREAELTLDDWKQVFNNIARDELFTSCKYEIAELLNALVEREGKPFALELLDQANIIAHDLWESLSHSDEESTTTDWLTKAINHPAGRLVEFWIRSLVLRVHSGSYKEKEFGGYYRDRLTSVIQDESVAGGMGRSVVASQLVFLFGLEEKWTREYVIPLFSSPDFNKFSQVWDGFLVGGQLYGPLSQALQSGFLTAIQRLNTELAQNRRRFIEYFTGLIVFHVDDPISDFLPALFTHGSLEDQTTFAFQLGFFLRHMPEPVRQNLWDRWLHRYWKHRLNAVPRPLEETELKAMLDWLPYLGELFPQGVSLILDGPSLHSPIEHGSLFFEIPKSDLITRFPAEMAKLIIYLCPHIPAYHQQSICTIIQQLLLLLNPDLKHEFTEAMVYCGFMQS